MTPRYSPREALGRVLTAVGFGVAFVMVTLFVYPRYGLAFALLIMLLLTIMLVRAFSRVYVFRCANCGHKFKPPMLVHYLTLSGMGRNPDGTYHTWKSLTCPSCGRRTRAVGIRQTARRGPAAALRVAPRRRLAAVASQGAHAAASRRAQALGGQGRGAGGVAGAGGRRATPSRASAAATASGNAAGVARTTSSSGRLSRNSRW